VVDSDSVENNLSYHTVHRD